MEIADLPLQICPDDLFVTSLVSVQLPFSSCPVFVMNILDDESYLVPPMQKATFLTIHAFLNCLWLSLSAYHSMPHLLTIILVIRAPARSCDSRRSQAPCMSGTSSRSYPYKLHDEPTFQKTSICPSRRQVGEDETVSTDQSWAS
jgi:hypothetical protein